VGGGGIKICFAMAANRSESELANTTSAGDALHIPAFEHSTALYTEKMGQFLKVVLKNLLNH